MAILSHLKNNLTIFQHFQVSELVYKLCSNNMLKASKTHPVTPSAAQILGAASRKVVANPGCVWIRTLQASMGAKAISAKNSALALAARYSDVRYK